jgi:hypothetical protein
MFLIYLVKCKRRLQKPITHLQFMVELCESLLIKWDEKKNPEPPWHKDFYYHVFTKLQKICVVCNGPQIAHVIQPKTCYSGYKNK